METAKLIHASTGVLVGILGLMQLIFPKKGKIHRIIGNIYTWSWTPLIITGMMIGSLLIAAFGLLGWYMAMTGFIIGKYKKVENSIYFQALIYFGFVVGLAATIYSTYLLINHQMFGIVGVFFGMIFFVNAFNDYRLVVTKTKIKKMSHLPVFWMFEHISRMSISYIAAMTAFFVIQKVFPIDMLNWLLPTVIGTAFIILYSQKLAKKYLPISTK
jgi:hypothetical protein